MSLSSRIVSIMNWMSDKDCMWWPFLKFRPQKKETFTNNLVIFNASIATIFGHSIIIIMRLLSGKDVPFGVAVVVTIILFVLALMLVKLSAYCWNVRAKELSVKHA